MSEKTRNPIPLFDIARIRYFTSEELLGKDLEDPANWKKGMTSDLVDDASATLHHGGGPNRAGEPIEEPELTWQQKLAISLGRVKGVLRSWLRYHEGKGWTTIAYGFCVSKYGRIIGVLRNWRRNAGQWGDINKHTASIVAVLGVGQRLAQGGWRALGMLWFAMGAPETPENRHAQIRAGLYPSGLHCHRNWNSHPESKSTTSCPSDERAKAIEARRAQHALPRLKFRGKRLMSRRGKFVRLFTARLVELGYLVEPSNVFNRVVRRATILAQSHNLGCGRFDGVVNLDTWTTIGKMTAI